MEKKKGKRKQKAKFSRQNVVESFILFCRDIKVNRSVHIA